MKLFNIYVYIYIYLQLSVCWFYLRVVALHPSIFQQRVVFMTAAAESLQSCLTLCNPIDGNPPGSPVPGILEARTLEWVAISFSSA